jgi:SAM-dependent methyltransferase
MGMPDRLIEADVRARFASVARDPKSERRFPVGPESAKCLGYSVAEVNAVPQSASESFAGVGNPLALGAWRPGDVVLDLGCGSGLDALLAAGRVSSTGRVIGVDLTPEMALKALRAARQARIPNVIFVLGRADSLPLPNDSVDVAITNGVFNLCVDKSGVVSELHRVLRPSGSLRMADILLEPQVTPEYVAAKGTWSD